MTQSWPFPWPEEKIAHYTAYRVDEPIHCDGQLDEESWQLAPRSPRFADMNNDHLTDLVVVADFGLSSVYLNVGDGMFEAAAAASDTLTDENGMGSAIGDYDNDGDLDWFISSIFDDSNPKQKQSDDLIFGGPAHGVTGNRLYRNEGGMVFADITDPAGVRDGNRHLAVRKERHIAGRVDDVDLLLLPLQVGQRGLQRDLALDLFLVEVRGGGPVVDLAQAIHRAGQVQQV